ncbi:triose-phosphate isomerase [Aidingimonas halophila]|uniref:Triosephosphate isomerase n=1 Tax=Aidingimonas halophila TaxID=574349 RepID=A0A1H2YB63_9GAMM|nr:triose-phosphate isomerase [Aidingimonas halophila]GHC34736.1 triosephosphate isomerase [Aidingimonas halophila]SDX02270.1 triosephosphate isomerase [Aidingimonas halophila]
MRSPLIAGNWKMNGSLALVEQFGEAFADANVPPDVSIALMLPFPYLAVAQRALSGTPMAWGGQTLHDQRSGAFTGEVSGSMLVEFGARYVLIGHSERRAMFHEDDAAVLARVSAALDVGLTPVVCVGETLAEREAGRTEDVVLKQVDVVFSGIDAEARERLVIAYEPVWAIGTGKTASPDQAQAIHASIRAHVEQYSVALAAGLHVLYGGSMKAANAAELLAQPDIDGGLIGGASLQVDEFLAICQSAG